MTTHMFDHDMDYHKTLCGIQLNEMSDSDAASGNLRNVDCEKCHTSYRATGSVARTDETIDRAMSWFGDTTDDDGNHLMRDIRSAIDAERRARS